MKIAYFDCFAGAAGDMIVAAMLDAGLDAQYLRDQLATLNLAGLELTIEKVRRAGLAATKFTPTAPHQHDHRNLSDIKDLINKSSLSAPAKKRAIAIFERLAKAEATVHAKSLNDIHFHEVGAVDSIADIVAAAIGLEALDVASVCCSAISLGGGTTCAAHGMLPVPAPATAELLKGVPTRGGPIEKELATPTGAAILTTVAQSFCALPAMQIAAVGYGAGTLESDKFPNVLRLIIGEKADPDAENADSVALLETNIDDVSGEIIGSVMENLLKNGAFDVFTTGIAMKQNRPAVKLSVICGPGDVARLERVIFEAGVTFGVRRQVVERSKLVREFVTVSTEYGDIRVKTGQFEGRVVNAKPEFSDCAAAAERCGMSVKAVQDAAMEEFRSLE